MTEPQFIPSSKPHSVEMPEGSRVAKSKSAHTGDDIRRNEHDEHAPVEVIEVSTNMVLLKNSGSVSTENRIKRPENTAAELANRRVAVSQSAVKGAITERDGAALGASATSEDKSNRYTTEMQEMNFPARVIQLHIENEHVREQLKALESLMKSDLS